MPISTLKHSPRRQSSEAGSKHSGGGGISSSSSGESDEAHYHKSPFSLALDPDRPSPSQLLRHRGTKSSPTTPSGSQIEFVNRSGFVVPPPPIKSALKASPTNAAPVSSSRHHRHTSSLVVSAADLGRDDDIDDDDRNDSRDDEQDFIINASDDDYNDDDDIRDEAAVVVPRPYDDAATAVEVSYADHRQWSERINSSNDLHELCRSADTPVTLWANKHVVSTKLAAAPDVDGRLPLHVLSLNHALADALAYDDDGESTYSGIIMAAANNNNPHLAQSFGGGTIAWNASSAWTSNAPQVVAVGDVNTKAERHLLHFVNTVLLKAYPAAMMTPDNGGKIPFEDFLKDWVNQSHHGYRKLKNASRFTPHFTNIAKSFAGSRWRSPPPPTPTSLPAGAHRHRLDDVATNYAYSSPRRSTPSSSPRDVERALPRRLSPRKRNGPVNSPPTKRERQFPKGVALTASALYAIKVLSGILDHLDKQAQIADPTPKKKRLLQKHSTRSVTTTEQRDHTQQPHLDQLKSIATADMAKEIVRSIAAIPDLVKTVLLVEDEAQRNFALSTTLMKRVMANKRSVGNWLTAMLQCDDRRITQLALDYLRLVSEANYGLHGPDHNHHYVLPEHQRLRGHGNGGPSPTAELHYAISHLDDFVPSLLSLDEKDVEEVSTLRMVRRVLDLMISRPFTVTVVFCDAIFMAVVIVFFRGAVNRLLLGASPDVIINFIYGANVGIFYFIIREIGKAMSLMMITRQARIYFWSFWNITDLLSTVLSLMSSIVIRTHFRMSIEGDLHVSSTVRGLLAVTTGLIWLRVLSFLKGINMQLATFVLAILQITRDILWFCVILLVLVVSFAQIFFTLLSPQSCTAADTTTANRACNQQEYYLRVYAILLGDFGLFSREQFKSVFSVILIVFYTFMVVLVLLNVLIAIASDSYEKCLVRSQNLFGRARVMMIAELVSFQNLLRKHPKKVDNPSSPTGNIYKSWWSSESPCLGWSRGSVVFFTLTSGVVLVWVVSELAGYFTDARQGNVLMSLTSILVNVALFIGIILFLSTGAADFLHVVKRDDDEDSTSQVIRFLGNDYNRVIRKFMLQILSTSKEAGKATDPEEWRGRLMFLQQEMRRMMKDNRAKTDEQVKSMEEIVHALESRLQHQMNTIEASISELRAALAEKEQQQPPRTVGDDLQETMSMLLDALGANKHGGQSPAYKNVK